MAHEKLLNGLAEFASSYAKRFLEPHYDALAKTVPGRALTNAGAPTRYGIEAALYALLAYADQQWAPTSPFGKMVWEVVMDAPAEISKRIVGGNEQSPPVEDRELVAVEKSIHSLGETDRAALLLWLRRMETEGRAKLRTIIPLLSDDELTRLASMSAADVTALIPSCQADTPPAEKSRSRFAQAVADELDQANKRLDDRIAARRSRRSE
jgi:hypothetical protein